MNCSTLAMGTVVVISMVIAQCAAFVPHHHHKCIADFRTNVNNNRFNNRIKNKNMGEEEIYTRRRISQGRTIETSVAMPMSFFEDLGLDKIKLPKNPFSSSGGVDDIDTIIPFGSDPGGQRPPVGDSSSIDAAALFSRAKLLLSTDLGVRDLSLLSPSFRWIGPDVVSTGPLRRDEYIAAGQFFDLRSTFPDLDYRAHDFRIDNNDNDGDNDSTDDGDSGKNTVRFTVRTVGTMRGPLRLRDDMIPPNGRRMICPPESISMTFDPETGLLDKMCSGFVLDRRVGNTEGLVGVKAAAAWAGVPPSGFETDPPLVVISNFFARPVNPVPELEEYLAPFPETVMIQLAKGVLASEFGTSDTDLLSDDDFEYVDAYDGPINKVEYLNGKGRTMNEVMKSFGGTFDGGYSNFRVDPYDPYRVWVDCRGSGMRTGILAGKEGGVGSEYRYKGPPEVSSFTFDDDGFCTRITTGAVVDPTDCNTGGLGGIAGIRYATGVPLSPFSVRTLSQIIARTQKAILSPLTKSDVDDLIGNIGTTRTGDSNDDNESGENKLVSPLSKLSFPRLPSKPSLPQLSSVSSNTETTDSARDEATKRKRDAAVEAAVAKKKSAVKIAEKKRVAQETFLERRQAAQEETAEKRRTAVERSKPSAAPKKKSIVVPSPKKTTVVPVKKVPFGVPTIKKWKKNGDGSITGLITGSRDFKEGEKVTTSPIASGKSSSGNVVKTSSGSRYFLD